MLFRSRVALGVGYVPEGRRVFAGLTVEENLEASCSLPASERRQRLGEVMALFPILAERPRARAWLLSGGQQQMLALARALMNRPKLLLLDEPLAALDRKLRESTRFEMVRLQEELGVTFIMVTHDQEEAMTLACRIAVMSEGRIAQIGTPTEIYEFPATRLVASFVGSINIFEGRVAAVDGNEAALECDALGGVRVNPANSARVGAEVAVAVRPEKIGRAHV